MAYLNIKRFARNAGPRNKHALLKQKIQRKKGKFSIGFGQKATLCALGFIRGTLLVYTSPRGLCVPIVSCNDLIMTI